MIKIYFLLALMSFPESLLIHYKGIHGYETMEQCQEKRIILENMIVDMETKRGKLAVNVKTFCLEFNVFPGVQIEKNKINYIRQP
tara:strand:+ start:1202 stop:1456 length:255 start_codon:yes stop_codon:yes gene_type:complete